MPHALALPTRSSEPTMVRGSLAPAAQRGGILLPGRVGSTLSAHRATSWCSMVTCTTATFSMADRGGGLAIDPKRLLG